MARVDPNELRTCDNCGVVQPSKWMQSVSHILPKGEGNHTNDYCRDHRRPYGLHTTTSGYDRYYRDGQEVTEEGSPIIRLKGARKSTRHAPPPTR